MYIFIRYISYKYNRIKLFLKVNETKVESVGSGGLLRISESCASFYFATPGSERLAENSVKSFNNYTAPCLSPPSIAVCYYHPLRSSD